MDENKLEEMSDFFNSRADVYDVRHLEGIDGGIKSKLALAGFLPEDAKTLLDFGVGTGLELDAIFKRFPDLSITGIDFSEKMLRKLREKFLQNNIHLVCGDYLTLDFGENCYDVVLSSMTLHHYTHAVKLDLYKKIRRCLSDTGIYIENDYMLSELEFEDPQKQEDFLFSEYERLKQEQFSDGMADKDSDPDSGAETYYHFDTPCTVDNQKKLLLSAGFRSVTEVWREKNNITLIARV